MGKTVVLNRKARHEYIIEETFEAGIALTGTEIKSIRGGHVSLQDAYARIERGEAWLIGAHVAPWRGADRHNHDPGRDRKLLLHRAQITQLATRSRAKGLTLVPLAITFNDRGRAKVQLGLARGKKLHDRRRDIAEREARRELDRDMADAMRGR
jgi:SsrA-binding protein